MTIKVKRGTMGRLLHFKDGNKERPSNNSERYLEKLFWDNARADVEALLRLYLFKYYGGEVYPEYYASELRQLREMQAFMPSTAEISLKMAFDMANMGGMKSVQTAMLKEKRKWAEAATDYGDENYLQGVVNAVTSDDSDVLEVMIENWMKSPKVLASTASMTKKRGTPAPVVNALVKGIRKSTKIDGKRLRDKVAAMSGFAIATELKEGKICRQMRADVLPFRLKK